MGLAIVKSIIEGHAGEIDVESDPEKGTRFIVTLNPYVAPEDNSDGMDANNTKKAASTS